MRAVHHPEKGYIVIFAGGNGQPFVTTDYPSVQRALEVSCEALLVAKQGVDGVFNANLKLDPTARRFRSLHYNDVIRHHLQVMDQSAFILARDYSLPIHVFNFDRPGSMKEICEGKNNGTTGYYAGREVRVGLRSKEKIIYSLTRIFRIWYISSISNE